MVITGKTGTGFEYSIDNDCLKDAEFLELYAEVSKGGEGGMRIFELLNNIFGNEQKKKLYDHCRNESGRVPIDALTAEITDVFTALGENPATKN